MDSVRHFIRNVRSRLWKSRLLSIGSTSLLTSGLLLNIAALSYIVRGYAVELNTVVTVALSIVPVTLLVAVLKRPKASEAAHFADRFFELNNGVVSMLQLADTPTEDQAVRQFIYLQQKQTVERCRNCDIGAIPLPLPKKRLWAAGVVLLTGLILCGFDDSEVVKARRENEEAQRLVSEISKKELQKELDELEQNLDKEEKKLFKSEKLKELIEKLKTTSDKKEALRQYAELERELKKISEDTKLKDEEKLLAELARQLQDKAAMKQLADLLKRKQYKKAAAELGKMKINSAESFKNQQKMNDKLRDMARRMKEAADLMKANSSSLKKEISALDKAAREMQKALKQALKEEQQNSQCSSQCKKNCTSGCKSCNNSVQKMCENISKTGTKSNFMKKMDALRKAIAEAQRKANNAKSCAAGLCPKPGQGKKPGTGSVDSRNHQKSSKAPGFESKITGQKGEGPSDVELQNSESGSGTSGTLSNRKKSVDFKKQMESFINRTDVPREMKNGVKEYFKKVHEYEGEQ